MSNLNFDGGKISKTVNFLTADKFLHLILCVARYDVELYQRIEQLIGKQLPLHPTVEEEVMALMERVTEAQRIARMVRVDPQISLSQLFPTLHI